MATLWEQTMTDRMVVVERPVGLDGLLDAFEAWLREHGYSPTKATAYRNAVRNFLKGNVPTTVNATKDLLEGLRMFFKSGYSEEVGLSASEAVRLLADHLEREDLAPTTRKIYIKTLKTFIKGAKGYEEFFVPVIKHLASAITVFGLKSLAENRQDQKTLDEIKRTIAIVKEKLDTLEKTHKELKELAKKLEDFLKGAH